MPLYRVTATNEGLTLNGEHITQAAIDSFSEAYPGEQLSHYTHPGDDFYYPPVVGLVERAYSEGTFALAEIDFDEYFARNFDSGGRYDVSIYCRCEGHFDYDKYILIVDRFIYDERNSIDVVPYGAALHAKVDDRIGDSTEMHDETSGKVISNAALSQEVPEFIRLSYELVPQVVEPEVETLMPTKQDSVADIEAVYVLTDEDIARIALSLKGSIETETEPDAVIDAFKAGAESGFDDLSVERVIDAVRKGWSLEDAIASERSVVEKIATQVESAIEEAVSDRFGGVIKYEDEKETDVIAAATAFMLGGRV